MGNEKRCVKTQPMDDGDVDLATTKQIGRILRDAGDNYDRLRGRKMGRGHLFFKLTSDCCRVLRRVSGWLWVRDGWRVFFSAVGRLVLPIGKCTCLHIGLGNENVQYTIGGTVLSTTEKEKD